MEGTRALVKVTPQRALLPHEDAERQQPCMSRKAGSHGHHDCQPLELGCPCLQNCERSISVVYRPPGLGCAVTAAERTETGDEAAEPAGSPNTCETAQGLHKHTPAPSEQWTFRKSKRVNFRQCANVAW